jgi:hypothetical protein
MTHHSGPFCSAVQPAQASRNWNSRVVRYERCDRHRWNPAVMPSPLRRGDHDDRDDRPDGELDERDGDQREVDGDQRAQREGDAGDAEPARANRPAGRRRLSD